MSVDELEEYRGLWRRCPALDDEGLRHLLRECEKQQVPAHLRKHVVRVAIDLVTPNNPNNEEIRRRSETARGLAASLLDALDGLGVASALIDRAANGWRDVWFTEPPPTAAPPVPVAFHPDGAPSVLEQPDWRYAVSDAYQAVFMLLQGLERVGQELDLHRPMPTGRPSEHAARAGPIAYLGWQLHRVGFEFKASGPFLLLVEAMFAAVKIDNKDATKTIRTALKYLEIEFPGSLKKSRAKVGQK